MDFWGYLYAELVQAAKVVKNEDLRAWQELDTAAFFAGQVFEDWRDLGATDRLTLASRCLYGRQVRSVCGEHARGIIAEAEKNAREEMIRLAN